MLMPGVAHRLEETILAGAIILPVMMERLPRLPVVVRRPEVDKIELVLDGPFFKRGEFLLGTSANDGRNLVSFTSTVLPRFLLPETTGFASNTAISRNGGGSCGTLT